nr:MAG TPA: hypothetical protein [Caudoviricetes sp.]
MKTLPASCGTPSGMPKPAICWHPARLRCVPDGWVTKAQTALRLRAATAATAGVGLASTFSRKSVSDVMRWTVCRRYAVKKKSLPVRQHGQAKKVMSFSAHHHKNNIKKEVLQVALLQIYDGLENPPKLLERRSAQTVGELVRQADALSEKEHAQGYPRNTYIVYNNDGKRVYQRW